MIRPMRWILVMGYLSALAAADTFTPARGNEILHGYMTSQSQAGKTIVMTKEKGKMALNLSEYSIRSDHHGRSPFISLIAIRDPLELEIQTAAFEKAVVAEADKGPVFLVVEIDSPGGRVDLVKRMCAALLQIKYCPTVAYVCGGPSGGAYSGGAILCLACRQIYMAKDTAIGAAAIMFRSEGSGPLDPKKVLGDTIGEKMNSAWRNYVGSLADQNNRPALLAKAMVDQDIVAVEIEQNGQRAFVESFNQKPGDRLIKTWSRKGSLLTLTASEAVECGFANGLASSRDDLLKTLDAASMEIRSNTAYIDARTQYETIVKKFNREVESIDLRIKQLESFTKGVPRPQALKVYQGLLQDIRSLIRMAQICPDLPVSQEELKLILNSVQAEYDAIRMTR